MPALSTETCQLENITIAIELAHEYVKLGKAEKAATIYSQTLTVVRDSEVSPETRTLFFSRYAENATDAMAVRSRLATRCFTRCAVDKPFSSETKVADRATASQYA